MTNAPLRVVAVDDEPPALRRLESLLSDAPGYELAATFSDPVEALAFLRTEQPDILLLDIQMPGLSGFELLQQLGDASPLQVIFITAYDEHAIRAFDVQAVDYLLKPIDPALLARALDRARGRRRTGGAALRAELHSVVRDLLGAVPSAPAIPLRVAIRTRERVVMLDPALIDRVDTDGNTLHVQAGRDRISFRETLTAFAERVPPAMFVRVNRSTLVNVARVKFVEPWFNGDVVVVLADGGKVTSGRTYRDRLREVLGL